MMESTKYFLDITNTIDEDYICRNMSGATDRLKYLKDKTTAENQLTCLRASIPYSSFGVGYQEFPMNINSDNKEMLFGLRAPNSGDSREVLDIFIAFWRTYDDFRDSYWEPPSDEEDKESCARCLLYLLTDFEYKTHFWENILLLFSPKKRAAYPPNIYWPFESEDNLQTTCLYFKNNYQTIVPGIIPEDIAEEYITPPFCQKTYLRKKS